MTTTTATIYRTRTHRPAANVALRSAGRAETRPAGRLATGVIAARRRTATVVAVGVLSLAGLGLHGVLSSAGDVPASAAGAGSAPVARTVKAHPGDTLWSIAEAHRGDISIRRYVDALVELNGGETRIDAGQLVRLP